MQPKGCEWLEKYHDAALEDCEFRWLFTMRYIFIHAAFLICVLDMIPKRKTEVQPNAVTDDVGWVAVAFVGNGLLSIHGSGLYQAAKVNLTMPFYMVTCILFYVSRPARGPARPSGAP